MMSPRDELRLPPLVDRGAGIGSHLRGDCLGCHPRVPRAELPPGLPHHLGGLPALVPPGGDGGHQARQQDPVGDPLPADHDGPPSQLPDAPAEGVTIAAELGVQRLPCHTGILSSPATGTARDTPGKYRSTVASQSP
jgi:hypothetical protein